MLTENFSKKEVSYSNTASSKGINNIPDEAVMNNAKYLAENLLQIARNWLGSPIKVNSWYRSPELNKAIGGAKNSSHMTGSAVDITCKDNALLFKFIRLNMAFDQLIWEEGDDNQPDWIHVSLVPEGNRRQVLKIKNG